MVQLVVHHFESMLRVLVDSNSMAAMCNGERTFASLFLASISDGSPGITVTALPPKSYATH
jgi:hypothetical protein